MRGDMRGDMSVTSNVIWTAKEAALATGGMLRGRPWTAIGVSIDSRSVRRGELFIALAGDQGDGHDYVAKALAAGAAAAVVSRVPEGLQDHAALLVVEDTFKALQDLGQAARGRSAAKIIAVTGSVGKTGTKDMLAAVFGAMGHMHAAKASYNNHWGVPLSLAEMHEGMDYGIFEIGMNHAGEITQLTKQVRPDIVIITTIASVHGEHFESEEQIAEAKAEIFDGMAPGGCVILNRDNEWFSFLKEKAVARELDVYSFGEHEDADVRLANCLEAANGSRVEACVEGMTVKFSLPIPGRHIVMNALSVLMAVKLSGGDVQTVSRALETIEAPAGRGRREYIDVGDAKNPVTLIDESYNASPVAMKAAFKVLALIDPGRGGRRIAVLGDMYELGKDGARLHKELALPLQAADVQLVYTSGPLMKNLYDALPAEKRGGHEDDHTKLAEIVPGVLVPGDVVMVKGSRGGGEKPRMQVVVEALRTLPNRLKKKTKETEHAV